MTTMKTILAMAALVGVMAGCATVTVRETRVVTGRVMDESGQPVPNNPVLIVARTLELTTLRLEYEERSRREVRAVTDSQGRFRIEFAPAGLGNNFFVFFYDVTGFDRIKYRRPEPLDLTERLNREHTVVIHHVLQFEPSWAEVARQMTYFGPESDRTRILRHHGLPDKRDVPSESGAGPEVWWYYADGVNYWFVGDRLTRHSQFPPIPPIPQSPPAR